MGDPLPDVDVDVDPTSPLANDEARPVSSDEALDVAGEQPDQWLIRHTPNSWNVWVFAHERRPRRLRDIRGKVAAITAGVIVGVLGLGGLISYAVSWVGQVDHASALLTSNMQQVEESLLSSDPLPTDPRQFLDLQVTRVDTPDGALGIMDGQVTSSTPAADRAAADDGFVADVTKRVEDGSYKTHTYSSSSTAYVYTVMPVTMADGTVVDVIRVIDLTSDRGRLLGGYLVYGLGSLAGAGAAGGAVWWGLGRRRDSIEEPDEV